jgi:tape measure domain-containing protein
MAENVNGALNFRGTLDIVDFNSAIRQMQDMIRRTGDVTSSETNRMDSDFRKLAATIGIGFGLNEIKNFGAQIMRVRGNIQDLTTAFTTMLGTKEKADALMSEIVKTAATTPFDLQGVAGGAKQLLAYGESAETVNDTLVKLGNIASGLSIPLNDMVYLYGTTQVQGRLFAQDVRQFMGRGIPLVRELAEMYGKTAEEINAMVSAGKIGFADVENVINKLTGAGGQFFNLMEQQSKNLNGQIANLQDAFDMMLNDLGTKSQDVFSGGISVVSSLVENYEKVGKVIAGLIVTYGAYKTAVILNTIAESGWTVAQMAQYKWLLLVESAQKLLNKTMLANPYVLMATVAVGLVTAVWALHDSTTAQEKAQKKLNDELDKAKKKKEDIIGKSNGLVGIIKDETQTVYAQIKAWKELQALMPEVFKGLSVDEIKKLSDDDIKKMMNQATDNMEFDAANEMFSSAQKKVDELKKSLSSTSNSGAIIQWGLTKDLEKAQAELDEAKNKIDEINKIKIEAEFNAKPAEEKLAYYQKELEKLEEEKTKLDELAAKYPKIITFENGVKKESIKITDEWGRINFEAVMFLNKLAGISDRIKDTQGKMSEITIKPSETYKEAFNNAQKAYKDAQKAVEDAKKGTKDEYTKAKENLKTASDEYQNLGGVTSKNTSNSDQQKRLDAQKKLAEMQRQNALENVKFLLEMRQKDIDLMDDNYEKKYRLIKLNQDKETLAIREFEENKLKQQQQYEEEQWKAAGSKGTFTPTTKTVGDLTAKDEKTGEYVNKDVATQINMMREASKKAYEEALLDFKELSEKAYEEENNRLASALQNQLATIEAGYAERLKQAQGNAALVAELERNQAIETQKAISDSNIAKLEAEHEFFEQATQLREQDFQFQADMELAILENKKKTQTSILEELEKQFAVNGTDEIAQQIRKIRIEIQQTEKNIEKMPLKKWNELSSSLKKCKSEIDSMIGSMDFLDDTTKDALKAASNIADGTIAMIENIQKVAVMAGQSISAVEKASVILAIIGAAVQIVTAIFNMASKAEKAHQEALAEVAKNKLAMQREYNLLLLEQNQLLERAVTIFGNDNYGQALGNVEKYKQAIGDLKKEMKSEYHTFDFLGMSRTVAVSGLDSIKAKTGHHKTGLFGWGKGEDEYTAITDMYDDLITKEGLLNVKRAQAILDTQTLSDADKEALQNMIDLAETAEEAYEEMKNYLSSIFGDLGSTMSDALTDAFVNGTDAAKVFSDTVSDMLAKLAQDMIYSVTLAPIMAKAQEDMLEIMKDDSLTDEQKFNKYAKLMGQVTEDSIKQKENADKLYETYQEIAKQNGIDIWNADEDIAEDSLKGAVKGVSEETASVVAGKLNAVIINQSDALGVLRQSLICHLEIAENTRYNKHLEGIYEVLSRMENSNPLLSQGVS